jgi:putative component of toxin-antitoxin plasmid stabilization module
LTHHAAISGKTAMIDNPKNVLVEDKFRSCKSEVFRDWLDDLRDRKGEVRVDHRLRRLAGGNAGDTKSVRAECGIHCCHSALAIIYMWRDGVLIVQQYVTLRSVTYCSKLRKCLLLVVF